jgi:hypothetical protein
MVKAIAHISKMDISSSLVKPLQSTLISTQS